MAIQFSDGEGITVSLDVDTYQFPNSDEYWDANWLQVRGTVTHPLGDWRFRDPCLATMELAQLAKWAANVASGETSTLCFFTEPCLSFELVGAPEPAIALGFSHEVAPPHWAREAGPFVLLFPLALNPLEYLERAVRELLCRFPIKGERG